MLVVGQGVALEPAAERVGALGDIGAVAPDQPHGRAQPARHPRRDRAGDHRHHRRGQERRRETRLAPHQRQQVQPAAHGVAEHDQRAGQARREGVDQDAVVGEEMLVAVRVALHWVGQQALRQPLAAPVVGQHLETPPGQVAHDLEVLLDGFGAAGAEHHRAACRPLRRKQRRAQPQPAGAPEPLRPAALGDRRSRRGEQRSGIGQARPGPWPAAAAATWPPTCHR